MFVYLKEPMAYTSIGGKRVCGKLYAFGTHGPTNISIEDYKAHKERLVDAEYPVAWLKAKFNKDVPPFTFDQLRSMEFKDLARFAKITLGIKYFGKDDSTTDTTAKNALLRALMIQLS